MPILGPDGKPYRSSSAYSEAAPEVIQIVEQAKLASEQGDPLLGLQQMISAYQSDVTSDIVVDATIELLQKSLDASGQETSDEIQLFQAIKDDRDNAVAYYQLGNRFFTLQRPFLARPFLEKCRKMLEQAAADNPQMQSGAEFLQISQAADIDYAQTVMDIGDYEKTIELLHGINDKYGGLPLWLILEMAECYALMGQLEEAGSVYSIITEEAVEQVQSQFPGIETAYEEVGDMIARIQDFDDPAQLNLRGWHYIQTRGILLETNPQEDIPGERFVFFQPSEQDVAFITSTAAAFLEAMDAAPTKLLWLGEESEPLARIFAHWWEIEDQDIRPYQIGDNTDNEEELSLLCIAHSYDIPDEETYADLAEARSGLLTFALDLHWTERQPLTPDIAGFMSQTCNLPWETRLQVSEDQQTATPIEETRDPVTIADEIASQFPAEADCDQTASELVQLYSSCKDLILTHRDGSLSRRPLPLHSPVKSPRFGF